MNQTQRTREDGGKRPTNVSLGEALLAEAKALGVNVSRACERGLAEAVRAERAAQWQTRNAAGFEAWDTYIERNGVPLAQYLKF
jgi:antitoxin CcdA